MNQGAQSKPDKLTAPDADRAPKTEDGHEARRKPIVLGELKTEEESRLAAEIEKLRDRD